MVVTVRSLGLNGIAGYAVSAECFLSGGLPAFDIVGLPDAAVREARERVRAAGKNSGFAFPAPPAWVVAAIPGLLAILSVGGFVLSYFIAQAVYAKKEF